MVADIAIRRAVSLYLSAHGQPELSEIVRGFPPLYEYKTAVENWQNLLQYLPLGSEFNKIRRYIEDVIETMTDIAGTPVKSSFLIKRPVFVESKMKRRNYRLTENIDTLDQMWTNYDPSFNDYAGPVASYDVSVSAPTDSDVGAKASKAVRMLKKRGYRTAEHAKRVDARTASSALSDADVDAILATHQKTYRAHEKQLKGVMAESVEESIDTKRSWNAYR
jgi:hypothetical protein